MHADTAFGLQTASAQTMGTLSLSAALAVSVSIIGIVIIRPSAGGVLG